MRQQHYDRLHGAESNDDAGDGQRQMFDAIITAKPASQKEQAFTYAAKVLRQATCRHIEERTREQLAIAREQNEREKQQRTEEGVEEQDGQHIVALQGTFLERITDAHDSGRNESEYNPHNFYVYLIVSDVIVSLQAFAVFGPVVQRSFRMRESVTRKPYNDEKTAVNPVYSSEYSLFCGINKQNRGKLNVSDDTLRRDLADLEANGLLTRVHGGAVSRSDTSARIMDRYDQDALAKQKMAEKLDKARTFQIATLNDIDYIVTDDKGATHIRDTWPKGKWNVL